MMFQIKYEDGPCAADCYETYVIADDEVQAKKHMKNLVPRAMITSVILVDDEVDPCYNTSIATHSRMNKMAKETKAERQVREAYEKAVARAESEATYLPRVMSLMQRAQKNNFELEVSEMAFELRDRDDRYSEVFELNVLYTNTAEDDLHSLEWKVECKEEATREANRKFLVKQAALAKLSNEEKELLGL